MKKFNDLTKSDVGKRHSFTCRLEEVKVTSGPTIFKFNDGTKSIKGVSFAERGKRAHPEADCTDLVVIAAIIAERDGIIEIEVKSLRKITDATEIKLFEAFIENKLAEMSKPQEVDFLSDNEVLQKLKPNIVSVAKEIRKAIFENRPILLRHHADCDGYTGAVAIERAILPLIKKQHQTEMSEKIYYKRSPSKSPFYDYMDAVKDLSFIIDDLKRFGQKVPLLLLVDNGSTEEDLLAIKRLQVYGIKVVVIDHHFPGDVVNNKALVDTVIDAHVNPYLYGYDSTLCAGVLATEVARFVNPDVENIDYLPALAAIGDRSRGPLIEPYLAIANKQGFDFDYLQKIGECIDFEAYFLRFLEARGLINDLLGNDKDIQKKTVTLLSEEIEKSKARTLKSMLAYMNLVEQDNLKIMWVEADSVTSRGQFPAIGKSVGLTHDYLDKTNPGFGVISMGMGPDFITFRMNDNIDFSIHTIIAELQEKYPGAQIDGGGHEHAGTIKYLVAEKDNVRSYVMERLKQVSVKTN